MQVFVFPGQGSQSKGMGGELFDQISEFTSVEKEIDALLGYSVRELCLDDPSERLNQTQFTQPALFVTNALHYYQQLNDGNQPDYVAGHSLGEYNALHAAGAFDLLTGVRLVKKRGELMGKAKDGGMAAIIGMSADDIDALVAQNDLNGIDIANYNSPSQTVISGPVDELHRAENLFKDAGVKLYKVLPVSAAFHSRYMKSASDEFDGFLSGIEFQPLQIPVVANFTGKLYPEENDPKTVRNLLVKQIAGSVQWTQSIQLLKGMGDAEFTEVGPGKVLARLIKQID